MRTELTGVFDELQGVGPGDVPVLSVYLNLFPERLERRSTGPRLRHVLHPVRKLLDEGGLDHRSAASLGRDVDRALELIPDLETRTSTAAMGIFLCAERSIERIVELPRRAWDSAVAGPVPYLRPFRAVLDEFHRIAVVTADSRQARVMTMHMGEVLSEEAFEAEELRKADEAGWYGLDEYRNRSHAEEVRHQLFREVAGRLSELRRTDEVEVFFVGGHRDAVDELLGFVDPAVRTATVPFTADLHLLGPAQLAKTVAGLEEEHERADERRLVEEVYAEFDAGDRAAVGLHRVLEAANRHAIGLLLVHDGVSMAGAVCPACGSLSPPTERCGACGTEALPVEDLLEALVRAVGEAGGTVEHVMTETRLAGDVAAAGLRFPVW